MELISSLCKKKKKILLQSIQEVPDVLNNCRNILCWLHWYYWKSSHLNSTFWNRQIFTVSSHLITQRKYVIGERTMRPQSRTIWIEKNTDCHSILTQLILYIYHQLPPFFPCNLKKNIGCKPEDQLREKCIVGEEKLINFCNCRYSTVCLYKLINIT